CGAATVQQYWQRPGRGRKLEAFSQLKHVRPTKPYKFFASGGTAGTSGRAVSSSRGGRPSGAAVVGGQSEAGVGLERTQETTKAPIAAIQKTEAATPYDQSHHHQLEDTQHVIEE
ncbi:hypothetical protein FOZ62_021684, partial [Perkinsus olseni]